MNYPVLSWYNFIDRSIWLDYKQIPYKPSLKYGASHDTLLRLIFLAV